MRFFSVLFPSCGSAVRQARKGKVSSVAGRVVGACRERAVARGVVVGRGWRQVVQVGVALPRMAPVQSHGRPRNVTTVQWFACLRRREGDKSYAERA